MKANQRATQSRSLANGASLPRSRACGSDVSTMKGGTANRKTVIAVTLLAISVFLFFWELRAPSATRSVNQAPAAEQAVTAAVKSRSRTDHPPALDPHLRVELLAGSEGVIYKGTGRDIFAERTEEIPKPIAPALLEAKQFAPPPPPPSPAPINLKFWGWASQPGEAKAIFLAQGENGFVAHEGEVIARRYKVVKIGPSSVEIEDLLSNNRQNIAVAF